jgi:hypothetical protein
MTHFVGLDISQKTTAICVVDNSGCRLWWGQCPSNAEQIEVVCLDARHARAVGRLTLNMLLSFAQFEREIAGERIRDKIAASKAKGMWMGGNVPLGYDVRDRKLVVSEAEASAVRMIFQRYAELGSVALLKAELERTGIVSKRRKGADAELSGGKRFSRGALYLMLQNWLYRGNVAHKEKIYPGQQQAIIEPELWQPVQDRLAAGRRERSMAVGAEAPSLLSGLIFDSNGARLSPTHAVKNGKRYRYYVSTALITRSCSQRPAHSSGRHRRAGARPSARALRVWCGSQWRRRAARP